VKRPGSAGEFEEILLQSLAKPSDAAGRNLTHQADAVETGRDCLADHRGIGPVPRRGGGCPHHTQSAVARGERPWILIAAFENKTANPEFDGVLEYAMERELLASRQIRVVPRIRVDDTFV
jgi:hypothetical protein